MKGRRTVQSGLKLFGSKPYIDFANGNFMVTNIETYYPVKNPSGCTVKSIRYGSYDIKLGDELCMDYSDDNKLVNPNGVDYKRTYIRKVTIDGAETGVFIDIEYDTSKQIITLFIEGPRKSTLELLCKADFEIDFGL